MLSMEASMVVYHFLLLLSKQSLVEIFREGFKKIHRQLLFLRNHLKDLKFCSVLERSVIYRLEGLAVSIFRESLQLFCWDKSGCALQEQVEKFSFPIPRKGWMTILLYTFVLGLPAVRNYVRINGVPFSLALSGRRVAMCWYFRSALF